MMFITNRTKLHSSCTLARITRLTQRETEQACLNPALQMREARVVFAPGAKSLINLLIERLQTPSDPLSGRGSDWIHNTLQTGRNQRDFRLGAMALVPRGLPPRIYIWIFHSCRFHVARGYEILQVPVMGHGNRPRNTTSIATLAADDKENYVKLYQSLSSH